MAGMLPGVTIDSVAEKAYRVADSMLAERLKDQS
jgi:hypothetical protein